MGDRMVKRQFLAITVFVAVSFSIHAKGLGEMSTIEKSYFDSSGFYIVFTTAERFDSIDRITMESRVAIENNDAANKVFSMAFDVFEISGTTIFIPIEALRKQAEPRALKSPLYYPFLSNQRYDLSFSLPGSYHIAEIFIESPIGDSIVNLLEVPIADKVDIQIISQETHYY